jgi:uncharacterized membrane protein
MSAPETVRSGRRQYLDWLRGVAVLVMILGHGVDSWTLDTERAGAGYRRSLFVSGMGGAPVFLFLAGVALALAAGARTRAGRSDAEVAALARTRGWQVFGLALLFRLQSWIISGGDPHRMLKVDILNVMGLSMLGAAVLWQMGRRTSSRALLLSIAAVCTAMLTPLVRATGALDRLPDFVEAYFRPLAGASFSLFPWAGFLFAGCAVGLWLDVSRTHDRERSATRTLAAVGAALALGGYAASFLPPIYAQSSFWGSSPTFFFVRLGVVLCLLSIAHAWLGASSGRSRLAELGRSSLFVYWVHVELAYGVISIPLHRNLSIELALLGVILLSLLMYALAQAKTRMIDYGRTSWWRSPASSHPLGSP